MFEFDPLLIELYNRTLVYKLVERLRLFKRLDEVAQES